MITNLLISNETSDSKYQVQRDVLESYMLSKRLPLDLRRRIRENIEYKWRTKKARRHGPCAAVPAPWSHRRSPSPTGR